MNGYMSQAFIYLIQVVFDLYILIIMLRFLLQVVRADFYNPVSQFLVRITNPPVLLFRKFVPGLWGIDLASVVVLLILQSVEIFLIGKPGLGLSSVPGLIHGEFLSPAGLAILALADLISMVLYIFLVTIFVRIIISWINPRGGHNPAMGLMVSLSEPVMAPARRLIPPISGIDLSPIAVLVVLQLLLILLVQPLRDLALLFL